MFGECKQDAIPMHNIKETSVQKTKDSLKTPNPMEVTRSIRCLQVVCAVLAVIVIVLTATLGSLMSEQVSIQDLFYCRWIHLKKKQL